MTTTATSTTRKVNSDYTKYFIDQLKDIYWAEKHIVPGLKKMCNATTNQELLAAFTKHLDESPRQMECVEQIFAILGKRPTAKHCAAMEGLLKEAEDAIEGTEEGTFVRDAALIMAAQKIEHYEIATYGTLRVLAGYMAKAKQLQPLFQELLDQEKSTDNYLTELAEAQINRQASEE